MAAAGPRLVPVFSSFVTRSLAKIGPYRTEDGMESTDLGDVVALTFDAAAAAALTAGGSLVILLAAADINTVVLDVLNWM